LCVCVCVCMIVCDLETSTTRRPRPKIGCWTTEKKKKKCSQRTDQARGWTTKELWFDSRYRQAIILLSRASCPACPIHWVQGVEVETIFPELKRSECEADH